MWPKDSIIMAELNELIAARQDILDAKDSMEAYRQSMGKAQDVLVLQPDSEYFRFLTEQQGNRP